jgi:glycosyltransferase involved in cell wall biosynthesis
MMAAGTALVTTAAGGIGSVIVDGVSGRIVPERDSASLAHAIADLLRQPSTRASIGARARDVACREHGWARVARAFDAIYAAAAPPRARS